MNGWFEFAKIIFYVGLGLFAILAVVVTIGGAKDIRALFAALDKQHKDHAGE
ncbi:MAG: hypothetical protein JXA11_02040 [Phycisphaerae bacterium]|nr:hypothetical protein [Phycisphaerae bacterium]